MKQYQKVDNLIGKVYFWDFWYLYVYLVGNEHASNTKNIMILRDYAITTQFEIFDTFTLWVTNIRSHMPLTQKIPWSYVIMRLQLNFLWFIKSNDPHVAFQLPTKIIFTEVYKHCRCGNETYQASTLLHFCFLGDKLCRYIMYSTNKFDCFL